MAFAFIPTALREVILIRPKVYTDARGFFLETYKTGEFRDAGIRFECKQANHSHSVQGVLRGLHYQLPPHAQAKLVQCIYGAIWDVAVDVRKGSPTYGRWVSAELTSENHHLLYIPEGFAHGFYTVSERADVLYLASSEYAPHAERGVRWDDPRIGVSWPSDRPRLSPKDETLPQLEEAEVFP